MTARTIFAALIILALAVTAHATPSTLIWIPSTDIQTGSVHLGIDAFLAEGGADDPATDFGLTFGDGKIEYGLDYFEGIDDPLYLNAKALLKDESPTSPRLVAGVYGLGTDGDTSSSIVYLLASKTLSSGRLTAGYGVGRKRALGGDNAMVLLGYDKMISDKWWAAVDYQGGESAFGALSAGVAYTFSPTTSLIVGYDWFNDSSLADCVTIQLDMNL
ncbi:MAG: hypothetical protein KBC96_08245 [Armatimonadetes bacterium]|nr:hypothetical protein [Armatimonadota bacterium]